MSSFFLAASFLLRSRTNLIGMAQVKSAVKKPLDAHKPYPGVALDGQWNILLQNKTAGKLVSLLPDSLKLPKLNMFRASLHPDGFSAYTQNFEEWGSYLLQVLGRLRITARDPVLDALFREVSDYPNVKKIIEQSSKPLSIETSLLVPCVMEIHGHKLSFFTTLTIFGSPRDITLHELFIELFYPSDESTEQILLALANCP